MRETILLVPEANGTELLRSLARYGKNTMCVRIMSSTELAETVLMRSGTANDERYIRTVDEPSLIFSFLREVEFFSSASFADAQNIAVSLDSLRKLIPSCESIIMHEKLKDAEFIENSSALFQVYDRYIAELKSRQLYDGIQLIRKAIDTASPLDADFITVSEFPITPLEAALCGIASGGNYRQMSLCDLFEVNIAQPDYSEITASYGASNEVEHIIEMILEITTPLDNCVVAATGTTLYSQLFYDIAGRYGIPVTFGCGVPLSNTTSAELLRNLMQWETKGVHGYESFKGLVFSESFDRRKLIENLAFEDEKHLRNIAGIFGTMRLSCDPADNKAKLDTYSKEFPQNNELVDALRLLSGEFERGFSYILRNYTVIRDGFVGRLDRSAVKTLCDEIDSYTLLSGGNPVDIIPQLLQKSVCCENSREGAIHITGIRQAMCSLRSELFVAGLSADNFPGTPSENYLVPDSDYLMFGNAAPTSEMIINDRKKSLFDLVAIASSLGNTIHLSYSDYDSAELKESNASSQLFDLFRLKTGKEASFDDFKNSVVNTGYFDNSYVSTRMIGKAYNRGEQVVPDFSIKADTEIGISTDKEFSPSAVYAYLACPKKYYYSYVLHIDEPEEDDVFSIISPLDRGLLVHELLEDADKSKWTKEELLTESRRRFNAFLAKRPPVNEPDVSRERDEILDMVENGYESSKNNQVVYSEYKTKPVHFGGITLSGRLDRLEKTADDKLTIVDFKTSRSFSHTENDIASCLQVLLYAAILEKSEDLKVDGGEFRYLRYNKSIKCEYNDSVRDELENVIEGFAQGLASGDFRRTEDKNNCKYCGFAKICKEVEQNG